MVWVAAYLAIPVVSVRSLSLVMSEMIVPAGIAIRQALACSAGEKGICRGSVRCVIFLSENRFSLAGLLMILPTIRPSAGIAITDVLMNVVPLNLHV